MDEGEELHLQDEPGFVIQPDNETNRFIDDTIDQAGYVCIHVPGSCCSHVGPHLALPFCFD